MWNINKTCVILVPFDVLSSAGCTATTCPFFLPRAKREIDTAITVGSWLCAQVVNRPASPLRELSQRWSWARWTVKPAGVLFAAESCGLGGWRQQGWKEGSGVKEENAPALPWLSGVLTLSLSNLAPGGGRERERGSRLIHLTSHTAGACSSFSSNFALPSFLPGFQACQKTQITLDTRTPRPGNAK